MYRLDFLSTSPKTFIFNKLTNKTNLGGILTLIYSIIVIIIISAYLYDFFENISYSVSYTYKYNFVIYPKN